MSRRTPGAKRRLGWMGLVGTSLVWFGLAVTAEGAPVTVVVEVQEEVQPLLGTGGGGTSSTVSSSASTTLSVFDELLLPRLELKTQIERAAARPAEGETEAGGRAAPQPVERPRTFGAMVRYERVNFDNVPGFNLDGNVYSTTLQMFWQVERFRYGVLVPYDYLDLADISAHRVGAIGFGQYSVGLGRQMTLDVLANGNYTYTAIEDHGIGDVNTFGGGVGLALTADTGPAVLGGAALYEYNRDDTGSENDHQHLLKFGADLGVRAGQRAIVTGHGTWTYDATDYNEQFGKVDNAYFEVGLDVGWSVSPTWRLQGGYKKVLGLRDFNSDMVFLGTLLRF